MAPYEWGIPVTGNIELFAKWKLEGFTITYVIEPGTGITPEDNRTYDYGTYAKVENETGILAPPNHVFIGWKSSTGKLYYPGNFIKVDIDITLTAYYIDKSKSTTLTFVANGPTNPTPSNVVWTVEIDVGVPLEGTDAFFSWAGYEFVGWNTEANGGGYDFGASDFIKVEPKGATLYGQWKAHVVINYEAGIGGSVNPTSEKLAPATGKALGSKATVDTGYTFDGWYDAITGGNKIGADLEFIPTKPGKFWEETTYYARFTPTSGYTVTYTDGVAGEDVFLDDVHPDLIFDTPTPGFSGATPTRSGYSFAGWSPTVLPLVKGDATYTALWEADADTPLVPPTPPTPLVPPVPPAPIIPIVPAPVIPVEPEPAPAPTGIITPAEAPLAAFDFDPVTPIDNAATPLAAGQLEHWALLNLILTVVGIIASIVLLAAYFIKRKEEESDEEQDVASAAFSDEEYTETVTKKRLSFRIATAIAAVIAIVIFILTEDMSLPMVFVDIWTIAHIIVFILQVVFIAFAVRKKVVENERSYEAV